MILFLCLYIARDWIIEKQWEAWGLGRQLGQQEGYLKGLNERPQRWKS